MIKADNLTKKFKNSKGIFNVSFNVGKGEVLGFIGPNGAGKSTTIRHLMGFLKPDSGKAEIDGLDCWDKATEVKDKIGYLPGEIVFPSNMSAYDFIKLQSSIRNIKDKKRVNDLIDRFNLNMNIAVKNMSKGMKQKLAIVSTFMGNPDVILLDEPSTGLDPLMQRELINLFKEEKEKGKTIFLSSHIFEEIETIADSICIIKDGKIVENEKFSAIHERLKPSLIVRLSDNKDIEKIKIQHSVLDEKTVGIEINNNENEIIAQLSQCNIKNIDVKKVTLSDIFEKYYV